MHSISNNDRLNMSRVPSYNLYILYLLNIFSTFKNIKLISVGPFIQ